MKEYKAVILTRDEVEGYKCECGNTSDGSGFFPCNNNGHIVEPDKDWNGLYICYECFKLMIIAEEKKNRFVHKTTFELSKMIGIDIPVDARLYDMGDLFNATNNDEIIYASYDDDNVLRSLEDEYGVDTELEMKNWELIEVNSVYMAIKQ